MTLTYFMARSAEVAYPRSQISDYRTIGPLVFILSHVDLFKIWRKEDLIKRGNVIKIILLAYMLIFSVSI